MDRAGRRVAEAAAWWLVLLATYLLLLVSHQTWHEAVAGVVLASLVTAVAIAAVRPFRPHTAPRRAAWRHLLAWPADVAQDLVAFARTSLTALAHLGRGGHRGHLEEVRLAPTGDPAAVRTWAVLVLSASPGSYALDVDVDEDGDRVLMHRIGGRGRAERTFLP